MRAAAHGTPPVADAGLRCPACRGGVLLAPDAGEARCAACGVAYPVRDDVVDLLPGDARPPSLAKWLMEAEPIVRIYESRLWRRSALFAAALGISFEREQAVLLDAARPDEADTVLDVACGPGIYTRPFARRVPAGRVFAIDLSLPMLRYAARRAAEEGLDNVTFARGTALDLPFAPAACEVVNCSAALHLFPDVPRALAEIARVLKPGGRFTVATTRREEGFVADLAALARRRVVGMDSFTAGDLERRLREAGLDDVRVHHARRGWLVVSARKPLREG